MFQFVFGKLYSYFPIKRVFLSAAVVFEIGSAVCGAAPASDAFIVGRAITGLGASGVFQGAMVIVAYSVEARKRPIYNGDFGSVYGISCIMGPLLAGTFTSDDSWRWCFYVNLPAGALVIVILSRLLRLPKDVQSETTSKRLIQYIDPLGMATLLPAIFCLLLASQWGGATYNWSSARIASLLVLAGVLLIAFIRVELKRQEKALVPPRVIRMRPIAFASLFTVLFAGAYFTTIHYLPIWFQATKGATTVTSSIMCLPLMFSIVLFSSATGALITAMRTAIPFFYTSTILSAIGAGLITTFKSTTTHPKWIGYQVLLGAGVGMGIQLPVMAVQAVLPAPDIPVGTAIVSFCHVFGGTVFLSLGRVLFAERLNTGIGDSVPEVCPSTVQEIAATDLSSVVDPAYMAAVRAVYHSALISTWYLATSLFAAALVGAGGLHFLS